MSSYFRKLYTDETRFTVLSISDTFLGWEAGSTVSVSALFSCWMGSTSGPVHSCAYDVDIPFATVCLCLFTERSFAKWERALSLQKNPALQLVWHVYLGSYLKRATILRTSST